MLTHKAQPVMIKTIARKSYLENVSLRTFTERMQLNMIVIEELEASRIRLPLEMAKMLHTDPSKSDMKPKIHDFVK